MFTYTSACAFFAVILAVAAEPPVRQNSKFSQQFQNPEQRAFQPYLLRPLGGQFVILQQLQNAPQAANNPQDVPVGLPNARNTTEVGRNSTVSEEETTEASRSEKLTKSEDEGVYYIYHPNGLLQKVAYATKDDVEKMAFSARLRYENVEPIRGPIYTYDPETFVFKRI